MKTVSLSGSLRGNVGKKDAKNARKKGLVPCVLYGGKEQIPFFLEEKAFKPILFTPDAFVINLNINEKTYQAILQDVQYHPVTDSLLHADFYEITPGKPVKISIPLRFVGTSIGVLRGGKIVKKFNKLLVKGLIENIPEFIEIDITSLDIGKSIKIENLKVPDIEFLEPKRSLIITVQTSRVLTASTDEETEGEAAEEGSKEGETNE
ncbi:MAG TPA: 50S ribosomal protein L25/general stress protein Ctc [Bacteroidales bacterium]|nr:50S ribosomal protein L25/general stress protein Ctc [Bacteroidales bacterium]